MNPELHEQVIVLNPANPEDYKLLVTVQIVAFSHIHKLVNGSFIR